MLYSKHRILKERGEPILFNLRKISLFLGVILLLTGVGMYIGITYKDSVKEEIIKDLNKQEIVVDTLTSHEKEVVENIPLEEENKALPTVIDKDNRGLIVGKISFPTLKQNMPIFKGEFSHLGDNMLYGAVTNKENQEMGKRNYVLSSHVVNNPNQLFTSLYKLKDGDSVFLMDSDFIYEYVIFEGLVVKPKDIWILDDVEGEALLTLYTCVYINEYEENGVQKTDRTVRKGKLVSKEKATPELIDKYFNY